MLGVLMTKSYISIPSLRVSSSTSSNEDFQQCYMESVTALPVLNENFVGRKEDIKNITKLLKFYGHFRIVTIIGMPGIGKSTTAYQLAYQVRNNGTVVIYIDLNGQEDINGIKMDIVRHVFGYLQTIQDFGVKFEHMFEQWLYTRCNRPLLLILDNYDQLVHSHSQNDSAYSELWTFINKFGRFLSKTTVIITTRKRINLAGIDIRSHALEPLSDDYSVDVIANQLSNNYERQLLRPIAELIGGVPLALEIAAGLINSEGISSVEEKLTKSLCKNLSPKDQSKIYGQSISACIRLSYDYLNDSHKTCGQYLSYFPASFSQQAAIFIVGSFPSQSNSSVEECLHVLEQWSLLQLSKYSDGKSMYVFHNLLKDFFSSDINLDEQLQFNSRFCSYYTKQLQDFSVNYLTDDRTTLAEVSVVRHRHNLLHMFRILEKKIQENTSNVVVEPSVATIMDAMSVTSGSFLAHFFTSFEIYQSLTKIVEYADRQYEEKFAESVLPQDFSRYASAIVFWADSYSFAQGKLPEEGRLSIRSLEEKIDKYISNIIIETCSFPEIVHPSLKILRIICYDEHHHTKLSLCPKGKEMSAVLKEKLAQFNHTECADVYLGELGLAYFELNNVEKAIKFLEMHIETRSPEVNPMSDPHIFVTLCNAYSLSGRVDKCDELCKKITSNTIGITVSGKNVQLFSLLLMYYWKYNKMEEAKHISAEIVHFFGDPPKKRGYRRNIRCLLAGIAIREYHMGNYGNASRIYHLIIDSSFSKSEYHKSRPLVAVPNDMMSIFSQFMMGVAKFSDNQDEGVNDINDAVTGALNIVENETLYKNVIKTAHEDEELVQIVTMGSKHLFSIVCQWGLHLNHSRCQQLQGIFTSDKLSQTQLLHNQLCGFDDPYGKSFDFWQDVPHYDYKLHELH